MSDQQIVEALAKLTTEQLEIIAKMVEELNAHYSQVKNRTHISISLAPAAAA